MTDSGCHRIELLVCRDSLDFDVGYENSGLGQ